MVKTRAEKRRNQIRIVVGKLEVLTVVIDKRTGKTRSKSRAYLLGPKVLRKIFPKDYL